MKTEFDELVEANFDASSIAVMEENVMWQHNYEQCRRMTDRFIDFMMGHKEVDPDALIAALYDTAEDLHKAWGEASE
jgi:hypothetical protein